MDDFLFLHPDKRYLGKIKKESRNFLEKDLKLNLHPKKAEIFPISEGIDFLGYRIFYPTLVKLKKGTVKRFMKRMKIYRKNPEKFSPEKVAQSVASWRGYAKHAQSFALVKSLSNSSQF